MLKENANKLKGNDKFRGFCVDLLNEIAKICKFNYTISLGTDGKYGSMNARGEWNGLVRELIDKVHLRKKHF